MNLVTRGFRNAFRNSIRTISIVIILGLSVGLALTMLVARQAVDQKIESVKSTIGNTVSIAPAGIRGFQGGGQPLTVAQLSGINGIGHVTKVSETLNDRLTSSTSSLVSAIDAGSFGNRQAGNSGVGFEQSPSSRGGFGGGEGSESGGAVTRTFTPPVVVIGANDVSDPTVYGGDTVNFTSGQALDPTADENVAVVGSTLATKNSLTVGSTFTAYGTSIKVVGIYDTGNTFSNAELMMPLVALQRLSSQASAVTSATVTVDSIDNIDAVTSAIKTSLGSAADVTNSQQNSQRTIAPLENVKSISLVSLIGALIAGSVIILLTMMMIVRERRREIGVMKAIGSSNTRTVLQFISEAVTLTVLGMIVGFAMGIAAANPITNMLVDNSASTAATTSSTTTRQGFGGAGANFKAIRSNSITSIKNIKASVGWDTLGYAVLIALVIAILGSAIPAYLISKIRPAEVMRAE
ncbi:MAG: FtsX-like permease family protein [Candidatus Saccharimonas sp.]